MASYGQPRWTRRTLVLPPSGVRVISTSVDQGGIGWSGSSHPKVNTTLLIGDDFHEVTDSRVLPWPSTLNPPPTRGSSSASVPIRPDVLSRIGEEGEDRCRAGVDHDLARQFSHQWFLSLVRPIRPGLAVDPDLRSGSSRNSRRRSIWSWLARVETAGPVTTFDDQGGFPQDAEML